MHMYNFLYSDSLLYTSFFFFLLYMVFIHVIVHVGSVYVYNYSGIVYSVFLHAYIILSVQMNSSGKSQSTVLKEVYFS